MCVNAEFLVIQSEYPFWGHLCGSWCRCYCSHCWRAFLDTLACTFPCSPRFLVGLSGPVSTHFLGAWQSKDNMQQSVLLHRWLAAPRSSPSICHRIGLSDKPFTCVRLYSQVQVYVPHALVTVTAESHDRCILSMSEWEIQHEHILDWFLITQKVVRTLFLGPH